MTPIEKAIEKATEPQLRRWLRMAVYALRDADLVRRKMGIEGTDFSVNQQGQRAFPLMCNVTQALSAIANEIEKI